MAAADRPLVRPDNTPAVTHEKRHDPFTDAPPLPFATPAAVARMIQQDGAAVGLPLDDAVAAELADAMLDALGDDEEAAIDLASTFKQWLRSYDATVVRLGRDGFRHAARAANVPHRYTERARAHDPEDDQ